MTSHQIVLPMALLLLFLCFSVIPSTSGIGQVLLHMKEQRVQRIPYDIPPVADDNDSSSVEPGILEDIASILKSFECPAFDSLKKCQDDSADNLKIPSDATRRLRSLELVYYKYLPSDCVFVAIIATLLLCALYPAIKDYLMIIGTLFIAYKWMPPLPQV